MDEIEKLKRRWQREDERKIESAISKFVADAEGRKFLWWLLEIGRIGTQPFGNNALHTAFNCGELNIGQQILDRLIFVSSEGYLQMMKENANEQRERDNQINAILDGNFVNEGDVADTPDEPGA
jgi:hypothetical protein